MSIPLHVVAASLAALAAVLAQPPRARRQRPRVSHTRMNSMGHWQTPAVLLAALATWSLLGGWLGLAVGVMAAAGIRKWLRALPYAAEHRRERERAVSLPLAIDLLAACVGAGASTPQALMAVSEHVERSVSQDLNRVRLALDVGGTPEEAWTLVTSDLVGVGNVICRSTRSGAPVVDLLTDLAREKREHVRLTALAQARALGVRSAGPLGICFLPAFVLIGIVPLVIGLVDTWL